MNGFENKMISETFARDNKLFISLPITSLLVAFNTGEYHSKLYKTVVKSDVHCK